MRRNGAADDKDSRLLMWRLCHDQEDQSCLCAFQPQCDIQQARFGGIDAAGVTSTINYA